MLIYFPFLLPSLDKHLNRELIIDQYSGGRLEAVDSSDTPDFEQVDTRSWSYTYFVLIQANAMLSRTVVRSS